jgi:acyl dehydratase
MTTSLAALPKGYQFPAAIFTLTDEWVAAYTSAVGDSRSAGFVPAMAVATLAVRALLERASLPPGALHAGQELSFLRPVRVGEELTAGARIVSRGERAGWVLMSLDLEVAAGGEPVMRGRATLSFPSEAAA